MSATDREIDGYYFEYLLTGGRPPRARLDSIDDCYEGFLLIRDGVSETRIGSIGGEAEDHFSELEQSFFSAGDRLAADASADAQAMADLLAELAS